MIKRMMSTIFAKFKSPGKSGLFLADHSKDSKTFKRMSTPFYPCPPPVFKKCGLPFKLFPGPAGKEMSESVSPGDKFSLGFRLPFHKGRRGICQG
jgi:hypothetical protein